MDMVEGGGWWWWGNYNKLYVVCGLRLQSRTSWTQCRSAKCFTVVFHTSNVMRCMFNHLVLELSAQCYVQQTGI